MRTEIYQGSAITGAAVVSNNEKRYKKCKNRIDQSELLIRDLKVHVAIINGAFTSKIRLR